MGGGLIVAIGAQNAFVLTQGVRRNYPLAVAATCAACDSALIALGVSGVGALAASNPTLALAAALGGAAFLSWYGLRAFLSMLRGGSLQADGQTSQGLRQTLLLTLAVTLLNPHVYLDTIVLMGSVSSQFAQPDRYVFGMGAVTASFVWFFSLSLGGRALAPLFTRPLTWRILDGLVCLTMWTIAGSLLRGALFP